jgi:hypothetical protein
MAITTISWVCYRGPGTIGASEMGEEGISILNNPTQALDTLGRALRSLDVVSDYLDYNEPVLVGSEASDDKIKYSEACDRLAEAMEDLRRLVL